VVNGRAVLPAAASLDLMAVQIFPGTNKPPPRSRKPFEFVSANVLKKIEFVLHVKVMIFIPNNLCLGGCPGFGLSRIFFLNGVGDGEGHSPS